MDLKYFSLIFTFLFVWIFLSGAFAQAPDSLTVDQVVKKVLHNNPAIRQAEEGISASRAKVGKSRSALYPDVTGEASYSRVGPVPELAVPDLGTFALFPENNYDIHIGVQHLLYDFGKRQKAIDLAESGITLSRDNLEAVKTDLVYRTILTFYNILFLEKQIEVIKKEKFDLKQHLEVTRKKVKTGSAIEYDVLSTQVRIAGAESQLEDARNSLEKQKITLKQLMALPEDTVLHLKGRISPAPISVEEDSLITMAERQRTEYRQAIDARTSASLRRDLAAKGKMPSLNLNLVYGVKNGYIPNLDALRGNWVAGLQIRVPVFDGFITRYKKAEAEAEYRAAGFQLDDTHNRIISQVQQASSDLKTSVTKLQTTKVQLKQARDARNMAKTQYETGVISNLELLDAQTLLTQAQFVYLKAQYNYVVSRYALERAIGKQPWEQDLQN